MANKYNSLSHTKRLCKYHIIIVPKYRRKVIYNQYRKDLQEIIRTLCKYKGVEIIEGHMMPDHVHLLVSIPPKTIRLERRESPRLETRVSIRAYSPCANHPFYGWL